MGLKRPGMRLHTRTWGGTGPVAVLLHAITSDSASWSQVGPVLANHGFRVIAPDLRGHGLSPRAGSYLPTEFAHDLIETIDEEVELAIGLSLGGWILALASDEMNPTSAVYVDPAWRIAGQGQPSIAADIMATLRGGREAIRADHPRWPETLVDAEYTANQRFDTHCLGFLLPGHDYDDSPPAATRPSLVVGADPPDRIAAEDVTVLGARGFDIQTVQGAGHYAPMDDCDGFIRCLYSWLDTVS